jgi:predicted SnoaL-like aldol condensation-catalyzing enzyme
MRAMNVSDLNKRKVRQFFDEVLNEGRLELIDELVAKDFIGHLSCGAVRGPSGVWYLVSRLRATSPDVYVKVDDQIAEEDRVVTRWRATDGSAGITIIRLLAGKLVDSYTECTEAALPSSTAGAPSSLAAGKLE